MRCFNGGELVVLPVLDDGVGGDGDGFVGVEGVWVSCLFLVATSSKS